MARNAAAAWPDAVPANSREDYGFDFWVGRSVMSRSQSWGDAALSRGRSTCMAMCGAIFLMALLMPAPARGLTGDDKDAAAKDAAKKDDVSKGSDNKESANKDNKTTETSNLPERELLERLLQQIQSLQARVTELEAKESAAGPNHPVAPAPTDQPAALLAPSTAPVPSAPTPAPPPTASIPAHPADIEINEVSPRLHLNAYGDVGFAANDQGPSADTFQLGSLDLFLTSRLSDHISVLGEFLLLAQPDNTINPDLERLMLEYKRNDYFAFGIGRYHTDIGYYNATFHHIQWFATPIGRPLMFRFDDEGGFMPLQEIGVSANGNLPSGKFGLHWVAEVGNGRDHNPGDEPAQNRTDLNHGKSFNINVSAHPAWFSGLITGFSFYHDDLTPAELPKIGQSIMDAYVVYHNQRLEWLNEVLDIRDAVHGGRTFDMPAFYSQVSYAFGKYRPYFRYAFENANDADPTFSPAANDVIVSRQNDASPGIRIDLNNFAALKFQYDRFSQRNLKSYNQLSTQLSFSF
jgi:hypothetical protein